MAFNNTAPLSYASGDVVKYVDAQRGLADSASGPQLTVIGQYNPLTGDIFDPSAATGNVATTRLTANTTDQQLVVSNTSRKGLMIVNEQSGNNTILIKFGGNANSTVYTFPLYSGGIYEMNPQMKWTGNVHVICAAGTCNVVVSDFS